MNYKKVVEEGEKIRQRAALSLAPLAVVTSDRINQVVEASRPKKQPSQKGRKNDRHS